MPLLHSATYDLTKCEPVIPSSQMATRALRFVPGITVPKGRLLGEISGATANEVQTLNFGGTVSGGTFTLSIIGIDGIVTYTTSALAYNISNANLKIAIDALLLSAGYAGGTATIGGGACPTDATATFGGTLAGVNMPLMTATSALTGAGPTLTVDGTTAGNTLAQWGLYDGTKLANPTVAPTLTAATGSTPTFVAGMHAVSYTFITAAGESLPSPAAGVVLTGGSTPTLAITVGVITLPTGATGVKYYVNGFYAGTSTGIETTLNGFAATGSIPPVSNTAFTATNGLHVAKAISVYDFRTDEVGNVIWGDGNTSPEFGAKDQTAPAWFGGVFKTTDLTGLTADAVNDLGRLWSGTVADGLLALLSC